MISPGQPNSPIIDTHAHLGMPDFELDRDQVVGRAAEAGLAAIINVGDQPAEWEGALEISRAFQIVYAALGIHPNSADQCNQDTLADLARYCTESAGRARAVGEIGLDYYREYVAHDVQKSAFRAQLDVARQLDLPVVIHNRDAHVDVLDILKRDGKGTKGVMHSFSGDVEYALKCIELGYMISLSGPVTFRNAADKHLVARQVPLEYLLVETDCPFLTPEPFRGRRNEPQYVQYTARAIARERGVDEAEVRLATTRNACRLFDFGF